MPKRASLSPTQPNIGTPDIYKKERVETLAVNSPPDMTPEGRDKENNIVNLIINQPEDQLPSSSHS
jgi:hypothetical protein